MEWCKGKKVGVFFDNAPKIAVRYCLPNMSETEKKSIKKYPFITKTDLTVNIFDFMNNKKYSFVIPKGYCYDGASIPRCFWRVIGSNTDNSFLVAALVHDYLCEHHDVIDNNRYLSTLIFNDILAVGGVPAFKRWLMKHSVDNYQKFCGWEKSSKSKDNKK